MKLFTALAALCALLFVVGCNSEPKTATTTDDNDSLTVEGEEDLGARENRGGATVPTKGIDD